MPIRKNSVRRQGSVLRDSLVHEELDKLYLELGKLKGEVSKNYIYQTISDRIGIGKKTVSYILNHTRHS